MIDFNPHIDSRKEKKLVFKLTVVATMEEVVGAKGAEV